MKLHFLRIKSYKRLILFGTLLPMLLLGVVSVIVYYKQDELIESEIAALNHMHKGMIVIGDTHVAPFKNFPYISIKVDSVQVFESKAKHATPVIDVADIYIGFNLWGLVTGKYDIQKLLVEENGVLPIG